MQYLVVKRADFTALEEEAAAHDNFLDALIEIYSTCDSLNHTILRGTDGHFTEYMQHSLLGRETMPSVYEPLIWRSIDESTAK